MCLVWKEVAAEKGKGRWCPKAVANKSTEVEGALMQHFLLYRRIGKMGSKG